jgi:hypothetical protein
LDFASAQALDYHLSPLRENDLIRQHFDDDGTTQTFEWSNLFRRLPKKTLNQILDDSDLGKPSADRGNCRRRDKSSG